jgi:hypothetical protein
MRRNADSFKTFGGPGCAGFVRVYEEIIYQTHVIIDPVAFERDAQLRTIHGDLGFDVFAHHHVTEIRDLLLTLSGNQKTRKQPRGDEYQFVLWPILLADGQPLLSNVSKNARLKLVEANPYPSGDVLLRPRASEIDCFGLIPTFHPFKEGNSFQWFQTFQWRHFHVSRILETSKRTRLTA